jgi:hypothetical protein
MKNERPAERIPTVINGVYNIVYQGGKIAPKIRVTNM